MKYQTTFNITVTLNEETAPDNLNLEAWAEWTAWRRVAKFKKYKTDRAAKQLAKLPHDAQMECVNSSITQEYQGIFPEKFMPKPVRVPTIQAQRSDYTPITETKPSLEVGKEKMSQLRMARRPERLS